MNCPFVKRVVLSTKSEKTYTGSMPTTYVTKEEQEYFGECVANDCPYYNKLVHNCFKIEKEFLDTLLKRKELGMEK